MSTSVTREEIETTRLEKLLAVVLAGFLLLGAVWLYSRLDDAVGRGPTHDEVLAGLPEEAEAIAVHDAAAAAAGAAGQAVAQARADLELRREAYRTALDAGEPAEELRLAYEQAQASFAAAEERLSEARAAEAASRAEAELARQRVAAELDRRSDREALYAFLARLGLAAGALAAAFFALGRARRRHPRYLPLAFAGVGAATGLAFVLAADYATDYFDVTDLGPPVLSVLGIVLTLASFAALQRYLTRRIPARRVRRRECPFCGYPATGEHERCEGCGRAVVAPCSSCGRARRVGTPHCRACGAA